MNEKKSSECECGGVEQKKKISKEISIAGTTIWVENMDAFVCEKCGEIYFNGEELLKLEKKSRRQERIAV